jgi:hypothetical protein
VRVSRAQSLLAGLTNLPALRTLELNGLGLNSLEGCACALALR